MATIDDDEAAKSNVGLGGATSDVEEAEAAATCEAREAGGQRRKQMKKARGRGTRFTKLQEDDPEPFNASADDESLAPAPLAHQSARPQAQGAPAAAPPPMKLSRALSSADDFD